MKGTLVDGRYRLVDALGEGTFGSVWRAEDTRLGGRLVAVKFLKAEFLTHGEAVARFESEADALAQVQHPNVVGVFDRGQWEGQRFLATELARGRTLREWLEAHRLRGALPGRADVLELFDQLCAGVAAAHAVRAPGPIVHRDLKPENVMVDVTDEGPRLKILDFGIAQLGGRKGTQTGALLGTLTYMAPEQGLGDTRAIAPWTDVFALGVILVEMLTLRAQPDDTGPWWGVALRRPGAARALMGAMRVDVPSALWDVAARALMADGSDRPADAAALRAALRAAGAPGLSQAAAALAATAPADARGEGTALLASAPIAPATGWPGVGSGTMLSVPPSPASAHTTMPVSGSVAPSAAGLRGATLGAAAGLAVVVTVAVAFTLGRQSSPAEGVAPTRLAAQSASAEVASPSVMAAPTTAPEPAPVFPTARAAPPPPRAEGCMARTDVGDTFHLRATDTTSRVGALELPGGLGVQVLSAGGSWRSGGRSRSYRVRVTEGAAAGSEGYVFLHVSEFVGRPECPQ